MTEKPQKRGEAHNFLGGLGVCEECGHDRFQLTVTRSDVFVLDKHGEIEDKGGSDAISRLFCQGCGASKIREEEYTRLQKVRIWREIETSDLDT